MKIEYKKIKTLPSLAWIAQIYLGGVTVTCGLQVETDNDFFIEGAWAGDFGNHDFDKAEWLCGTGGIIRNNQIVFATPTGMQAGIFMSKHEDGKVVISNSLPLIMASEGLRLNPKYPEYEKLFNYNILQGINKYEPNIPVITKTGKSCKADTLQMILFRNVVISEDGAVHIEMKPEYKGFDSFDEYYTRLVNAMQALADNAADEHRGFRYGVTSLISSGYDCACCSAIARKVGANKVMTFSAKGKYLEDSGIPAARRLGYTDIIEGDAYSFMQRSDMPETIGISCGNMGGEASWAVFEDEYKGNLVFSGENGDFLWGKNKGFQTINDEYHIVWKTAEFGLCESHLHNGSIPVPMTNFGFLHWPDLYRISNSEEMKAWSVGGDYDRPIPRRILEEAGLPRESFGMKKYGAGFYYAYDWKKRILARMSKQSAQSFERYIRENKNSIPIKYYTRFLKANWKTYWNVLVSKFGIGCLKMKIDESKTEERHSISNPFAMRYVIPWGNTVVVEEYERKLLK